MTISFLCWEVINSSAEELKFIGKLDSILLNDEIHTLLNAKIRKNNSIYVVAKYTNGKYDSCVKVVLYNNDTGIIIETPTEKYKMIGDTFHKTHSVNIIN